MSARQSRQAAALNCLLGAFDYIEEPLEPNQVRDISERMVEVTSEPGAKGGQPS